MAYPAQQHQQPPAATARYATPGIMRSLLEGLHELVDRINHVALASCGTCGNNAPGGGASKERVRLEPGLARLFAIRPLGDENPDAARTTQRGARLLHECRIEESLRELHDAKRLVPRSHVARCNLGCAYFERGDEDTALNLFREANRMAPHDEIATLATALLEQRCNQLEDAQWLLVNFLQEVDPGHPGALRQLARLHQLQGSWQQAASCFRRLSASEPANSEWPRELELCLERMSGNSANPHSHYSSRRGAAEAPANQWQTPLSGDSAGSRDKPGKPRAAAVSTQEPGGGFETIASHREPRPPFYESTSQRHGALYSDGACLGGHANTRASFQDPLARPPGGYDVRQSFHAGACPPPPVGVGRDGLDSDRGGRPSSTRHGDWSVSGGNALASELYEAEQLREAGNLEAALGAYRATLRQDRNNSQALKGVADCLHDLGQHDSAIEESKKLLNLRPDDSEANLRVAELLISTGRPAYMAETYLQRASIAPPKELRTRLLCASAEAALAADDYKKALSSASEAVRGDALEPRALVVLANARIHVADYDAALRALSAALNALSGRRSAESTRLSAKAHMLGAQARERLRQYAQALEEVQLALDLDPRLHAARIVRATALQQSGRDREAHAEVQEVLRRHPQNVSARLLLGYLQLLAGDRRASSTLESALSGSSAPRSTIGAAKIYLAMALDAERRSSGSSVTTNQGRRAEQVLKEGLTLHRNLQVVWRDLERSLLDQPPSAAVQRLRGICDLDLTSLQARHLLQLLVRMTGRADFMRALGFSDRGSGAGTPEMRGGSGPGSRSGSVPPSRYAPGSAESGNRLRSASPWHGHRETGSRPQSPAIQGSLPSPQQRDQTWHALGRSQGGGGWGPQPPVSPHPPPGPNGPHPRSRPLSPGIRGSGGGGQASQRPSPVATQSSSYAAWQQQQQQHQQQHAYQSFSQLQQPSLPSLPAALRGQRLSLPQSNPHMPLEMPYRGRSHSPTKGFFGV